MQSLGIICILHTKMFVDFTTLSTDLYFSSRSLLLHYLWISTMIYFFLFQTHFFLLFLILMIPISLSAFSKVLKQKLSMKRMAPMEVGYFFLWMFRYSLKKIRKIWNNVKIYFAFRIVFLGYRRCNPSVGILLFYNKKKDTKNVANKKSNKIEEGTIL